MVEFTIEYFPTRICEYCGGEIPKPDLKTSFITPKCWARKRFCDDNCRYAYYKENKDYGKKKNKVVKKDG